jgi:hypothetical protein
LSIGIVETRKRRRTTRTTTLPGRCYSHPEERTHVSDLQGRGLEARIADGLGGGLNLLAVEVIRVKLILLPDVRLGVERDGRRARGALSVAEGAAATPDASAAKVAAAANFILALSQSAE